MQFQRVRVLPCMQTLDIAGRNLQCSAATAAAVLQCLCAHARARRKKNLRARGLAAKLSHLDTPTRHLFARSVRHFRPGAFCEAPILRSKSVGPPAIPRIAGGPSQNEMGANRSVPALYAARAWSKRGRPFCSLLAQKTIQLRIIYFLADSPTTKRHFVSTGIQAPENPTTARDTPVSPRPA